MKAVQIVACATLFLMTACNGSTDTSTEKDAGSEETTIDETVTSGGIAEEAEAESEAEPDAMATDAEAGLIEVEIPEFKDTEIKLYEAGGYSVYTFAKETIFTTGSAGLRTGAEQTLRKISSALNQRNKVGQIAIQAYIDATDNPNYNRDVAGRRVAAIKEWFQNEGKIESERIVANPVTEISSSATDASIQRSVSTIEIVVQKPVSDL